MQSTGNRSDSTRHILHVHVGALSLHYEALTVEASKQTTAEEIVSCIVERLSLPGSKYELAEVAGECKERRLAPNEKPVSLMLLWPMHLQRDFHRFYLREAQNDVPWLEGYGLDPNILRDFLPFLVQPENREYPDLCQLPDLNESTLLENLRQRFEAGHIYTYVGSILIAVNPFKFYPIYNPKYVRLYQNQRIGPILPPHIFAIADNAYNFMLKEKRNQCVVISGESGSGKTESTNFLLHHLTALSQKGSHGSGVEQTILSAGPVLEAFGNAKTAHNNNSSRFGKFIQVNYRENGMVQGAVVQKYLLEKSRIVSQGPYERNYHVFYYLLSGASEQEKESLHLLPTNQYSYLNAKNLSKHSEYGPPDGKREEIYAYEFSRLKQSMEMVGFSPEKQRRLFSVLSAVLHLGNIEFSPKKSTYHHDESVQVKNLDIVAVISELLKVKQDTLLAALTSKKVKASGETLVMQYRMAEAIAARDALAKCLYGALFDWIVLQVNHALLNKEQSTHTGHSIGVLDIFGFEDFDSQNSFEQFCINYANEHLQQYFNTHVFKYEQNEYKREGIMWQDIEFKDNSGCLQLFESKPTGLLCILDDLCNFPGATNETLLQKFNSVHKESPFYEKPQKKEYAFIIRHYAGKVKYQVTEMREKNLDLMRQDIVSVLKNSSMAFVRELVGADPVAVFRWAILRAFFRGYFAFRIAGIKHRRDRNDQNSSKGGAVKRFRPHNEIILRKNRSFRPKERPKKGLKNLQTVKTLTAGQNLSNQTAIKTRKQPLTVTAQFQNSLSSLMDTLHQANPFFIRCIKSNSEKIPNKFDDPTVVRQLRYTGMLETVRIRRAGYNVRLTYEEFIHLYRILLPKGLLSSQKDVKDFMLTMDLNRQHYQLGTTKIYMRESEKIRLDLRLHTKIIDSILMLQRWFRTILQRKRFLSFKNAAVKIQSNWRSYAAQKQLIEKKQHISAAIIIQSVWRMYSVRKWVGKLRGGLIVFQSHIRGFNARVRFKQMQRQKRLKDRTMLKSTRSLPTKEFSTDHNNSLIPTELLSSTGTKPIKIQQFSLDTDLESLQRYTLENKTTNRLLPIPLPVSSTMLSTPSKDSGEIPVNKYPISTSNNNIDEKSSKVPPSSYEYRSKQFSKEQYAPDENLLKDDQKSHLIYNLEKQKKQYIQDELDLAKSYDLTAKQKFHKTDSNSFDASRPIGQSSSGSYKPTIGNLNCNNNAASDSPKEKRSLIRGTNVAQTTTVPHKYTRRDLVCRSTGDEMNSNYRARPWDQKTSEMQQQRLSDYENAPAPTVASHSIGHANKTINEYQMYHTDESAHSPRGKAATLLGAISEDSKMNKIYADSMISKSRKVKSNLTETMTSGLKTGLKLSPVSHSKVLVNPSGKSNTDSLRRRNSDPSTSNKVPLLEVNRGNDMYQSSTNIDIAGHRFCKATRIGKAEKCASCQESDSFVNEGHRCLDCKVLVHTKCIQNGGVKTLQCEAKRSKRVRNKNDKSHVPNSKYQGTREYTDSTDKIISDAKELRLMQDFIAQKICKMDSDFGNNPSDVDQVFKQALREFKENLVTQYSVANKQNVDSLNIKYRDLIANFEQVMEFCSKGREDFPLTMYVNAFRGFMNEFMNSRETEKPSKTKRKKEKKRKVEEHTNYNGHTFQLTMINITTACEICQLFLLWPIERVLVCQNCRLTCHKKCYQKTLPCNKISLSLSPNASSHNQANRSKLFGCTLTTICSVEGTKIPLLIEQLMIKIEMHGLYTEGLYRKCGVASKAKELEKEMSANASTPNDMNYDSYNVHILTSVLKTFLREMPEPLLTFDRYDDFLRAADLSDNNDRAQTLLSLIKKLPPYHHSFLERLIFHLALVAQREKYNRMSAGSLAIIFAPCVLRTNRPERAQDCLNDIGRQTQCMETLITQKMLNVKNTLADIDTLDTAAQAATTRLSSLRSSKVFTPEELAPRSVNPESEAEEKLLEGHIQEIKKEKALLTSTLPNLARASSDDDLLSTDLDGEGGSLDDLSSNRCDKDTLAELNESKESKDSIDSYCDNFKSVDSGSSVPILYKSRSLSKENNLENSSSHDGDGDSLTLSYNLRFQNIDYIPGASSRSFQTSLDRDTFLKGVNVTPSRSPTTSNVPNTPDTSRMASRWRGSQGNLSYTLNPSGENGDGCTVEKHGRKPIATRSMSGGYDNVSAISTTLIQSYTNKSSNDPSNNTTGTGQPDRNTSSRKPKRQNSLDDEPIMMFNETNTSLYLNRF